MHTHSSAPPPPNACSSEFAHNKDAVTSMLLQVVLNIDNPYTPKTTAS